MKDERFNSPNQQANANVGARLASSAETNGCELQRQRYWSELKEHERIDRTREVVKRLEMRLEMAEAFICSLMDHKHDTGGALTGPLDLYRYMPKAAKADWEVKAADERGPDAVYF